MHWAANNGHSGTVQVLIANGATSTICDFWGRAPLHLAESNGDTDTANVLRAAGMNNTEQ